MKNTFLLLISMLAVRLSGQISFTSNPGLLSEPIVHSGVAIGVCDINADGRDDVVRLDEARTLRIDYQRAPNQPFLKKVSGIQTASKVWGLCIADADNNGYNDIMLGDNYGTPVVMMTQPGGLDFTKNSLTIPETFVQNVNFADVNNDGWVDLFICHDDGPSRIMVNDGAGNFAYFPDIMDFSTVPSSDESGNYGSIWSDIDNDGDNDLYIAKCRQLVTDPNDGRRINMLFVNNGDGTYTQDVDNVYGLRNGAQSWTADFGDIDNDGDMDCFVTNHDVSSQLFENDGAGHFTEITQQAGLLDQVTSLAIQGIFRDFDNDGYLDILVVGSEHLLFRNNGNQTFSKIPGIFDTKQVESCAVGDLNADGFLDVVAGYAEIFNGPSGIPDAVWLNEGNANHFIDFKLQGITSNKNGIGARLTIHTPSGIQIREMRSGEHYGIMNSLTAHFGLGTNTTVDSVEVIWPSGMRTTMVQPAIDAFWTLGENGCTTLPIALDVSGPTAFCTGDSVVLSVAGTFSEVQWNTGAQSPTLTIKESGYYSVRVTDASECVSASDIVEVIVDPDETPALTALGDTVLCRGESVVLSATPAAGYLWSTGETTQAITVDTAGVFSVKVQGLCSTFQSDSVAVQVLEAAVPFAQADTIAPGETAHLEALGDTLYWYNNPVGGSPLAVTTTGEKFETPALFDTTTFWVENHETFSPPTLFTGMTTHQGTNGSSQFNGGILFDALQSFTIKKVTVYAIPAGERSIQLQDLQENVLYEKIVFIEAGTHTIELNIPVPEGAGYFLTTGIAVNQASFGTDGPQLKRSDVDVQYPYTIPGVVSLYDSNFGLDRYYYFYNWEIELPGKTCISPRIPVEVIVDPSLISSTEPQASGLNILPNPAIDYCCVRRVTTDTDLRVSLFNSDGKLMGGTNMAPGITSVKVPMQHLPSGIYFIHCAERNRSHHFKITKL